MKHYLIIVLAILSSCTAQQTDIEDLVLKWQGKEIVIPAHLHDVLDRPSSYPSPSDYTLFTYLDTTGCTGCRMKLKDWEQFLNKIDSISDMRSHF